MTEISHYGVKGMKWGVRRDHQVLDKLAGRRSNPGGETKEIRKERKKERDSDWKKFKSETTSKERRKLSKEARASKADYIINTVVKDPKNTLVATQTPAGRNLIVSGEAFVEHLKAGGAFNVLATDIGDKNTLDIKEGIEVD